jgi:hypothetical protein
MPSTPKSVELAQDLQQRDERRREVREDLRAGFNEMDGGNFVEPTDDEFARAVNERALKHMTG